MNNNEIYHSSFVFTLFRITKALRYIYIDFERSKLNKVILTAYFETSPSEIERELMDDIASDIAGLADEIFDFNVSIITTTNHFDQLEKTPYLLYARFEGIGHE